MAQARVDRSNAGKSATRLAAALTLCAAAGMDGGTQLDRSAEHDGRACSAASMQEGKTIAEDCRRVRLPGETWRVQLIALDGMLFTIGAMTILGLFANPEAPQQNRT